MSVVGRKRLPADGLRCLVLMALLCCPAHGDVILTAGNLNDSIKKLQRLERRDDAARNKEEKARIVLAMAREADALTQRFSDEVAAHGDQQKGLIDLGLRRVNELGFDIEWSEAHGTFLYDGARYREYLRLRPAGPGAAQSAFRLIYIDFFSTDASRADVLAAAAEQKREFLARYPESEHAAEVGLLLGIDYRDLWRLCRESGGPDCSGTCETQVREQLQQVSGFWPGTRQAALAQRLLQRFEQEVREAADGPPIRPPAGSRSGPRP